MLLLWFLLSRVTVETGNTSVSRLPGGASPEGAGLDASRPAVLHVLVLRRMACPQRRRRGGRHPRAATPPDDRRCCRRRDGGAQRGARAARRVRARGSLRV